MLGEIWECGLFAVGWDIVPACLGFVSPNEAQ